MRLLGRRVLDTIHAAAGDIARNIVQHLGQPDIDDVQPSIVTEDQRGRPDVGVHQPMSMHRVERLAGVETDDECLRWRQQPTTVEEIAQAATGEVLGDHVQHIAVVPGGGAVVVDCSNVGMVQPGR